MDQELDSLRSLLYAPEASSSNNDSAAPVLESAAMKLDEKDQEYDQFVRELVFEKRAKPKDRTKTEEELALEEKEALEKAERRRIRRMNGEELDTEDEDGDGTKNGKRGARGGDDLEDDFMKEDAFEDGLGAGLGDMDVGAARSDEESGGDEDEDDEEDKEGEAGEAGGVELMASDEDEDDEDDDEEPEELVKSSQKRSSKKQTSSAVEELPFTFPCPSSHDEFLDIVENISDNDVPTVVKRIRALHHPSLAEDNKFKLQVCTDVVEYWY